MKNIPDFIGLNTTYPTADGRRLKRTHLDGAASPLASKRAIETINNLLPHYSNTHSYVHSSAQISTNALAWAHETVLNFLGADSEDYASVFIGAGTTAAINRVARGLHYKRPDRNIVLVSSMEHHANDLPHRQFGNEVIYLPLEGKGANSASVDLNALSSLCEKHSNQINYLAISSVSNVTGIKNPIKEVCQIAHEYGILVLVDGAQSVAHESTDLSNLDADFFVFSGHKIYSPMSPGVLVAKRSLLGDLAGQDLGGGSVSKVSFHDYELVNNETDKEESGTPNIVGAIALASVLDELVNYGLGLIQHKDQSLMFELIKALKALDEITIYADHDVERTGALAFNHAFLDHGLFAAILNDYFAIAVRNECFCAHPYVSTLLKDELWQLDLSEIPEEEQECFINKKRGMVRASLSFYNTEFDVNNLITAIKQISSNIDFYKKNYIGLDDGSYKHIDYSLDWEEELGLF